MRNEVVIVTPIKRNEFNSNEHRIILNCDLEVMQFIADYMKTTKWFYKSKKRPYIL